MSIQLTEPLKELLKKTAIQLKGSAKRKFIAQTVLELEYGGHGLRNKNWDGIDVLSVKDYRHPNI